MAKSLGSRNWYQTQGLVRQAQEIRFCARFQHCMGSWRQYTSLSGFHEQTISYTPKLCFPPLQWLAWSALYPLYGFLVSSFHRLVIQMPILVYCPICWISSANFFACQGQHGSIEHRAAACIWSRLLANRVHVALQRFRRTDTTETVYEIVFDLNV